MKLTIESCDNGFILQKHSEGNTKSVIYDDDEREAMKILLTEVAEYFGETYDKFKEDNLNITFSKKGHKIE